ncbi:ATP-dependent helicase [Patescibacteria group bacterium]|nr:ATP-dependent helicase [Patescibacteria group bacterium]
MVTKNPLSLLDAGQLEAVTARNQHILCLAGAGSGKTRVLTTRVFYLVNKLRVRPENILAITFTKNAATEMVERLGTLGINTDQLWCRTFHSACYKILRESDGGRQLNIIDEATQERALKKCLADLSQQAEFGYRLAQFLEENNWPLYLFAGEVNRAIHECKNYSVTPAEIHRRCHQIEDEDIKEFYQLFGVIFATYQNYLAIRHEMDFSDLISKVLTTLQTDRRAREKYQNKFKYILVDEFQDVNHGQVQLLDLLKGCHSKLFAVGDDWQAIYGWRGGDVKYILRFKKNYQQDCRQIILPFNYRSDGNIVQAASKCIGRNHQQCRKKIKSFHSAVTKIKIFRGENGESCHAFVLKEIAALIQSGAQPKNIMILGRNWKHVDFFIEQFSKNSVPKLVEEPNFDTPQSNPSTGSGFTKNPNSQDINITTIHSAKGLECDFVFLVGLHRGRGGFPNIKEDHELRKIIKETTRPERLAEERRCFYVAITRAKNKLYLVTEKNNESIFIKEVPRRFCEHSP